MPSYFVTATGTDIGKTYITCGIIQALKAHHKIVSAIKPIISGWDVESVETDTYHLIDALGLPFDEEVINNISPWKFKEPLSPDMAAKLEGKDINFDELKQFCRDFIVSNQNNIGFIEGVGGVMVPINTKYLISDLIAALEIPVILVAGTYLGTLSHTLTAYNVLKQQNITVNSVVLSESVEGIDVQETVASLEPHVEEPIFTIPRRETIRDNDLEDFKPVVNHLLKA